MALFGKKGSGSLIPRREDFFGPFETAIDRMVDDAEAHATEDQTRRENAEARNQADHVAYQTEKMLGEYGDKVSADEKAQIEAIKVFLAQLDPGQVSVIPEPDHLEALAPQVGLRPVDPLESRGSELPAIGHPGCETGHRFLVPSRESHFSRQETDFRLSQFCIDQRRDHAPFMSGLEARAEIGEVVQICRMCDVL